MKLQIESDTDDLTGLYNRKAGFARMQTALSLCQRLGQACAVFVIDIDFFKSYNDVYGHMRGDDALAAIAECIKARFARSSDIVCRMGGEEFAVFVIEPNAARAVEQAESLLKRVEELRLPSAHKEVSDYLTVSVGISVFFPQKNIFREARLMELLDEADRQLYNAKSIGRNKVCWVDIPIGA
jgi:diguanylate cyclase (GGDEF)-like protein